MLNICWLVRGKNDKVSVGRKKRKDLGGQWKEKITMVNLKRFHIIKSPR